jgi:uncharacterized protein YciI
MKRLFAVAALSGLLLAAADEPKYEMDKYVLGLLSRGPKWTPEDTAETRRIQEGHMANIKKMAETGKLIVAGPIGGNEDLRGIFIFQGVNLEEARAMADRDPAIQSGRLVLKLYPWWAGKGLRVDEPK